MKKLNQRGFSLIEGLLIIIAIALIGFVGFYVYNANKKTDTSANNSSEIIKNDKGHDNKNEEQKQDNSFEFKELGVKINRTTELAGLTYSEDEQAPRLYNLTTPEFKEKDTDCAGFFAQIAKSEGDFGDNVAPVKLLKQFDGYYIYANFPTCTSFSDIGKKYTTSLEEAFKTAKPIE
ncbi:MAG TPA: hypothetical protein VD947_01685 [Patescibacteria group bacterium]|nr:hypothetical protein [Patescibacteria group bacterium]